MHDRVFLIDREAVLVGALGAEGGEVIVEEF